MDANHDPTARTLQRALCTVRLWLLCVGAYLLDRYLPRYSFHMHQIPGWLYWTRRHRCYPFGRKP